MKILQNKKYLFLKFFFFYLYLFSSFNPANASDPYNFINFNVENQEKNIKDLRIRLNFKEIISKSYLIEIIENKLYNFDKNIKKNKRKLIISKDINNLRKLYPNKKDLVDYDFRSEQNLLIKKIMKDNNIINDLKVNIKTLKEVQENQFFRMNIVIGYYSQNKNNESFHEYGLLCPLKNNMQSESLLKNLNSIRYIYEKNENPLDHKFLMKHNQKLCRIYID
tara:strand:- start:5446 stop:6111 length:666 start_codon:yes stop_codon:yes gene_type:complete